MKGKIFNAQEVQAIIAGNKTQFREVIKEIGKVKLNSGCAGLYFGKCPYQVGQKIFCKESFSMSRGLEYHQCHDAWYWADGNPESGDWTKPKPAQHMKQEQSRLTLQIKEIKVERLADISEEDAIAEGMEKTGCLYLQGKTPDENKWVKTEISDFAKNWNATHKKPEEKFEANPWVWCVSFEVVK